LKQLRKRLTYANVMSSIAVFLVLGGGAAFAANQLGKNSVGKKQLKANSVTAAKIKKNAITTAKIKNAAVTGAKVKDGSITGAEINAATLATVPNSATTNVVKAGKGTLSNGQEAVVFEHGPVKISVKCIIAPSNSAYLSPLAFISSSTGGTVFTSWEDGSKDLGPGTPENERELNEYQWAGSTGEYNYDSASDVGVSATAANGQSFTAFIGLASEKDSNTCWYWSTGTIIS
jgi:hypothetical protein